MATLSSPGLGSGLDINGLITKLMSVEQAPLTALAKQEASFQAKLSAYGSMKSTLSTFQTAISSLTSASTFNTQKATAADTTVLTATATSSAALASYSVEVSTLAQAQKLRTSSTFATTTTALGAVGDKLTIDFGSYSAGVFSLNPEKGTKTVTLASGQNTLSGVRDAINTANIGVSATLINDGTGYRLLMTSASGAQNALRIATTGGLGAVAYDASTGGITSMTETTAAQNAAFTLDGVSISKASNTITDAIDGVTLNLLKTNVASATTLSVTRDTTAAKTAISSFVTAFNTASTALRAQTAYDASTKKGAILQGDGTALSVQSTLRSVLNTSLTNASGGLTNLSEVGISFNTNGTISLNTTTLDATLADTTKDVASLFAATGKATDSLISYSAASTSTKPGSYAVSITQIATQGALASNATQGASTLITNGKGKVAGSAAAGLTISAGSNDTFTATIDGTTSGTITLTAGTYTAGELASHLQTKINADATLSAATKSVTVTQASGVLTVTSDTSGVTSSVALATVAPATTTVSGLLGGAPTTTAGTTANDTLNVTVNGAAAALTLTPGTYTNANLVLMLQAAINGDSTVATAGAAVTATIGTTKGRTVGSTAAELVIDATNDTFTVSVDGTASGSISLTQGTYTAATLASELESKINADATLLAATKSVTVTQSSGVLTVTSTTSGATSSVNSFAGIAVSDLFGTATAIAGVANGLTLTSNAYGSGATVTITGGSAATTLFGTVTAGNAGLDVAGTIGATAATGFGKFLTSTAGDATGLRIEVNGGAFSAGGTSRGTFSYEQGFGYRTNATITALLATTGTITSKTDGINSSITAIGAKRTTLNRRLTQIEARYRKQFNALDSIVASMQQTSQYLSQQLAALSSSTS